jgi:hypothetical protein
MLDGITMIKKQSDTVNDDEIHTNNCDSTSKNNRHVVSNTEKACNNIGYEKYMQQYHSGSGWRHYCYNEADSVVKEVVLIYPEGGIMTAKIIE